MTKIRHHLWPTSLISYAPGCVSVAAGVPSSGLLKVFW